MGRRKGRPFQGRWRAEIDLKNIHGQYKVEKVDERGNPKVIKTVCLSKPHRDVFYYVKRNEISYPTENAKFDMMGNHKKTDESDSELEFTDGSESDSELVEFDSEPEESSESENELVGFGEYESSSEDDDYVISRKNIGNGVEESGFMKSKSFSLDLNKEEDVNEFSEYHEPVQEFMETQVQHPNIVYDIECFRTRLNPFLVDKADLCVAEKREGDRKEKLYTTLLPSQRKNRYNELITASPGKKGVLYGTVADLKTKKYTGRVYRDTKTDKPIYIHLIFSFNEKEFIEVGTLYFPSLQCKINYDVGPLDKKSESRFKKGTDAVVELLECSGSQVPSKSKDGKGYTFRSRDVIYLYMNTMERFFDVIHWSFKQESATLHGRSRMKKISDYMNEATRVPTMVSRLKDKFSGFTLENAIEITDDESHADIYRELTEEICPKIKDQQAFDELIGIIEGFLAKCNKKKQKL